MQATATTNGTTSSSTSSSSNGTKTIKNPIERLSETVQQNPLDFDAWVQLLALMEAEPSISKEKLETTYNRFLTEFPLCFGYWNKYAQYEYSLGKIAPGNDAPAVDPKEAAQKAREIYERGIDSVRYSVDMWVKYCEFLIDTIRVTPDEARKTLENALEACGSDPHAGPLWDMYIALETANNDMVRLNSIFKRILTYPLSNLDEFWDKYNHFVLAQQLSTLATREEIQQISGGDDQMDEGMLRIKIVSQIEQIKNKTAQGIAKRQIFENGIDRTYFHVTPVTEASLKNWHAYLDYEEITGEEKKCQQLYERCLISCANYQDIWVRYANWKEKTQGFEAANAIFQRAVNIFLKYRATIFLEYAFFLEANQKIQQARDIYTKVTSTIAPTLAEAYVKFCNFERRQKDDQVVKKIYQQGISTLKQNHEYEAFGFLVVQYATFVEKKLQKTQEAREIYLQALEQVTSCLVLWLSYLHFELNDTSTSNNLVDKIEKIYTKALGPSSDLSNEGKNDLWFQYAEFMENYGSHINQVRAVYEKEITWKRKNQMPRTRTLHLLELNTDGIAPEETQVGVKRARPDSFGSSSGTPSAAASAITANTTASATPTAQYYQNYQQQYAAYYQHQHEQ